MKKRPKNIPLSSQLLIGIGASAWFYIEQENQFYRILRYSEEGEVECDSLFSIKDGVEFDIDQSYEFTYISHCQECTILQHRKKIRFQRLL